jgi:hypothetical protein
VRTTKIPPKPHRTAASADALSPSVEGLIVELMRYRGGHETTKRRNYLPFVEDRSVGPLVGKLSDEWCWPMFCQRLVTALPRV